MKEIYEKAIAKLIENGYEVKEGNRRSIHFGGVYVCDIEGQKHQYWPESIKLEPYYGWQGKRALPTITYSSQNCLGKIIERVEHWKTLAINYGLNQAKKETLESIAEKAMEEVAKRITPGWYCAINQSGHITIDLKLYGEDIGINKCLLAADELGKEVSLKCTLTKQSVGIMALLSELVSFSEVKLTLTPEEYKEFAEIYAKE